MQLCKCSSMQVFKYASIQVCKFLEAKAPLGPLDVKVKVKAKNVGQDMAIVGEPCNTDAHAKIPALFMSMLCTWLRNMSSTV